jgi:hypothetical protein
VLVYFSTHGSLAQAPGGRLGRYLVARDTRMEVVADTGLAVDRLVDAMAALPSRRQVLILAACHSGQGKSRLARDLADKLAHEKAPLASLEEMSEAAIVLAAAGFGETAREDDRLGHDVYTYFLLEALERGDRDGDGAVTVSEAHDYARERTYVYTNGQQRPFADSQILGVDPIVLRGVPSHAARPVLFSYSRSADGLGVVVDGRLKGELPGGVVLDPGVHQLALVRGRARDPIYHGTIAVAPGQVVDLYDVLPGPPQWQVAADAGAMALVVGNASLPAELEVGAHAGARGWPIRGLAFDVGLRLLRGSGTTDGFGEMLAFDVRGARADARLFLPLAASRRLTVDAGITIGALWAAQQIHGQGYRGSQSVLGGTAGAVAAAALRVGGGVELGIELELGALHAALGGAAAAHAFVGGAGFVRLRR